MYLLKFPILHLKIFISQFFRWSLKVCSQDLKLLQSTTISNTSYLQLSLSQTFFSFPSARSVSAIVDLFGISNPSISNFCKVELFTWSLQRFLRLFFIFISVNWMLLKEYIQKCDRMFIFFYFNTTSRRSSKDVTSKV